MNPRASRRHSYIDWLRGIAVLLMIQAHTTDAWTRLADKKTYAFGLVGFLGGFAAPLFLWLAGLSAALAAANAARRDGSRWRGADAVCRRGLELFVLAFLFRLQAFIVSPGSHPVTVFRVDILNVMGPAIALAGLLWAVDERPGIRAAWFGVAAVAVAMVTPVVRTMPSVDALPVWLQWYVRPAGEHTTFTGFPWIGFVFAGAACGALVAAVEGRRRELVLQVAFAVVGAGLIWLGRYTSTRPSLYAQSSFWTSSPTWFAIRVGVLMIALATTYGLAAMCAMCGVSLTWLERFGRRSLFVYWIHVELVYGYASWLWRGRLPLWGATLAFALFVGIMYGAVILRDRVVDVWRDRPRGRSSPAAVTA